MRTWHRSASACTTAPLVSAMRSRASRFGVTAYGSGTMSRTTNPSDVMSAPRSGSVLMAVFGIPGPYLIGAVSRAHLRCGAAAGGHPREERRECGACLLAAVEPAPGAPQQPDQFVAGV